MLRASLRSLFQHKLRLALTLLAIVVGVAFVAGTYIFTDSLKKSFDALFDVKQPDVTVSVDNQVTGNAPGGGGQGGDQAPTLPTSLIDTISQVKGAAAVYGAVRADGAVVIGADGKVIGQTGPPARGVSWVPDPAISSLTLASGKPPTGADQVALLESTAASAGVAIGSKVRIETPAGTRNPTVVGLVSRGIAGSDGATLVVFDLPTAQAFMLESTSKVTDIVVQAESGTPQKVLAQRIDQVLPKGAKTQTGQERSADLAKRLEDAFGFINTFLLVFALIALFVACFLIYNTFSMLVAQRTRELALLRAVGATRGQIRRAVVSESIVIGLVASALGLLGGIAVSQILRGLFSSFGATLPGGPLVIAPRTVVVALVVGLVVTVTSAYVPARRAAIVPPVAAMRDEVSLPVKSLRIRTIIGGVLLVLAVITARIGLNDTMDGQRAASWVGLSALAALIATIAVAPIVGKAVLVLLAFPFSRSPVGRLARENGRRNPRRTAATAGALAVGLALMTTVGVIASSAKASVNEVVDNTIGADYVVFGAKFQPFTPQVYQAVKGTTGTSVVTYVRNVPVKVSDNQSVITGVDPEQFPKVFDLTMEQGSLRALGLGGALVDSTTAREDKLALGQEVPVTLVNGKTTLRIQGIYTPAGFAQGFIVTLGTLSSIGARELDSAIYIRVADGADKSAVRAELDKRLAAFPSVELRNQSDLKDEVNAQFDRVFGFIYALLVLAVLVAFLGIVNTLALSVYERTREVGLLRAVGTSRSQIRRMVVLESVLIALFGAAVGVVLGLVYGTLLQKTLEPQGVTVLSIPTGQVAFFLGLSVIGGFIAALWPAFTAARLDVLKAIATE